MIVLHCSTAATVEGTIHWFLNRNSRVSSHYVVDKNGDIYQMVREDLSAWHAKAANSRSIGIEHVAAAADQLTNAQSVASGQLVHWLAEEYGIPAANVVGHRFAPGNEGSTDCPNHLFGDATAEAIARWVTENVAHRPVEPRKRRQAAAKADRPRALKLPNWARPATWFAGIRSDLSRIDRNMREAPQNSAARIDGFGADDDCSRRQKIFSVIPAWMRAQCCERRQGAYGAETWRREHDRYAVCADGDGIQSADR